MPSSSPIQSFLLQARARKLSLRDIFELGEDGAYEVVCKLRWPDTDGQPVCPRCATAAPYRLAKRKVFKCRLALCHYQFTPTSGTAFHSRKMSYVDLLVMMFVTTCAVRGIAALQVARTTGFHPKTAWVFGHKVREAVSAEAKERTLSGIVETDGAYFGGHVRPANRWELRVDRRLARNQSGKRRVVVAARKRHGEIVLDVFRAEHESISFLRDVIDADSQLHADEANHWDVLEIVFPEVMRINHSQAYSLDGACTNWVESFFSRLRNLIEGQHRHVSPEYLADYARFAAWLEDNRKLDNLELWQRALHLSLTQPVTNKWKGRWQRKRRTTPWA